MLHPEHVRDAKKENPRNFFPTSKSRAKQPLDLVHSDLDKMPVLSIGRYKCTATHLDFHSSHGVMFYLKNKSEEFAAFKTYKAWAERQLGTTLKCRQFDHGGEFLSNKQKIIWQRMELNINCPCQILCHKMDEWKGSRKPL